MEAADQPPGQGLGGTVGGNLLDPSLKSTVRPSLAACALSQSSPFEYNLTETIVAAGEFGQSAACDTTAPPVSPVRVSFKP
jgi:hypothetical protein